MHPKRTIIRLGQRLLEAWRKRSTLRRDQDYLWNSLTEAWSQLLVARRRLQLADDRGFIHCRPSLWDEYSWQIEELSRRLQPLKESLEPPEAEPGLAAWVQEFNSLEEEFGEIVIDEKRAVLRVATEPITLNGILLGAFAIELHWNRLGECRGTSNFDIVAISPHPASGRDEITHPHVNEGDLCAGDAAGPVERALNDGRISDAFVLIRSVLTTYNARSAFVQLSEWYGFICGDCNGRTSREESSYCRGCEMDLCECCSTFCRSCEETRCAGCLTACSGCGDDCCSGCLDEMPGGGSLCSACRGICSVCSTLMKQTDLNDDGLCSACAEAQEASPTTIPENANVS